MASRDTRRTNLPVLLLGADEIGTLDVRGHDMPWTYGEFSPLPGFAQVAALFRQLEDALAGNGDSADDDADLQLLEQVNRLGLVVRHRNGTLEPIHDFKIEAGQFEYKAA